MDKAGLALSITCSDLAASLPSLLDKFGISEAFPYSYSLVCPMEWCFFQAVTKVFTTRFFLNLAFKGETIAMKKRLQNRFSLRPRQLGEVMHLHISAQMFAAPSGSHATLRGKAVTHVF